MFHVTLTSGLHLAAAICLGSLLGCNQSPEVVGSDEPSEASVNSPDTPGDSPVTSSDSPDTSSDRQSGILVASTKPPEQPGHKHRNRLADQTSPYLLMHAHNPVDWYPWGEEALNKAKRENKLIFLSIGYSSCHWCHVMERESFMDEEIAAYLNEHFVCIKLDREERPDIDNIYMMAVQMMTGRGGWPLSAFLTPDAKPFFGGTYFPARDNDRPGHTGFLTIVKRVNEIWGSKRDEIEQSATRLTDAVSEELAGRPSQQPTALDERLVERVMATLSEQYDPDYGGFGYDPADPARPKFPEPSNLLFLVQRVRGQNDQAAREMLEGTLQRMAMGGIRDHLAGGFHRYSVDRYWRIPHFEKMLYDNGQLASVYAEAYQLTGRDNFRRVTVELLDFVQREMSTPEGAFYSALDADTEGEEGKFYRWTKDELDRLLSEQEKASFGSIYGLSREPNFEGHYFVPQLSIPLQESAETAGMSESELHDQLLPIRQKLLAERNMRVRPMTDTKVLTGWNGLMIRGLADAGRLLDEPSYNSMAARAAEMLLAKLRAPDGRLLRTYSEGEAKLNAYLDDYAFFVDGLIALHRSTGDRKWLALADDLTAKQIELFWDELNGGFFFTSFDHEELIARGKSFHDGVRPAGNSVAASNLLYLADALPKPNYIDLAEKTIQAASTLLERSPASAPRLTLAVAELIAAKSTGAATNP